MSRRRYRYNAFLVIVSRCSQRQLLCTTCWNVLVQTYDRPNRMISRRLRRVARSLRRQEFASFRVNDTRGTYFCRFYAMCHALL